VLLYTYIACLTFFFFFFFFLRFSISITNERYGKLSTEGGRIYFKISRRMVHNYSRVPVEVFSFCRHVHNEEFYTSCGLLPGSELLVNERAYTLIFTFSKTKNCIENFILFFSVVGIFPKEPVTRWRFYFTPFISSLPNIKLQVGLPTKKNSLF